MQVLYRPLFGLLLPHRYSFIEANQVLLNYKLYIDSSQPVMITQPPKKQLCNLPLLLHSLTQVSSVSAAGYLPGSRCHAPPCWRWQEALHYCCKSSLIKDYLTLNIISGKGRECAAPAQQSWGVQDASMRGGHWSAFVSQSKQNPGDLTVGICIATIHCANIVYIFIILLFKRVVCQKGNCHSFMYSCY